MLNLSELRSQDAAPDVASPERAPFAQYVVIPYSWLGVLDAIAGRHAHRLMLRLMWISWRQKSPTVKLTNKALGCRMDRHTKSATLRRLEQAGVISVQWRPRKSPLVTILFPKGHPAERYWR